MTTFPNDHPSSTGEAEGQPTGVPSRAAATARWLLEIAAITALFAAAGSWPVPDTNEAHYLTKARHSADPAWCPNDFFLSTRDAHVVFFKLLGPLAASRPLDEVAWAGRLLGWLMLAIAVRQAASVMLTRESGSANWKMSFWTILAAAFFSLLARVTPASGEWVIGGFESKVFAWSGVIMATAAVMAGRFGWAWTACGAAAAIHPLVGGWGFLEVGCVASWRLFVGIGRGIKGEPPPSDEPGGSGQLLRALLGLMVGGGLASFGVIPAADLSREVDPAVLAEAARIQVEERLPHHLLPDRFQQTHVVGHLLAVGLMLVAWAAARPSKKAGRLVGMAISALCVSLVGLGLAAARQYEPSAADQFLKYYWFRSADGMVPLAAAILVIDWLRWGRPADEPRSPQRTASATLAFLLLISAISWDLAMQQDHWPKAAVPATCRADRHVEAEPWQDLCEWIRQHTPDDAIFMTPRGAATFTWRTSRAEVVSWKNMPQDPASVVEWRLRIFDLFSPEGNTSLKALAKSTVELGEDRLRAVANKYAANHIVAPLKVFEEFEFPANTLERLYENDRYGVYRITGTGDEAVLTSDSPGS
jgi:hypothetical protein